MQDRELYVADSFQCEKYAFKEYIYRGVVVDELQLTAVIGNLKYSILKCIMNAFEMS